MVKFFVIILTSLVVLFGSLTKPNRAFKVLDHVATMHSKDSSKSSHHHHDTHHHHTHKKSNSKHSQKENHSHEMDLSLSSIVSLVDRKEIVIVIRPVGYFNSTSFFEPSLKMQSYTSKIFRPPIV